MKQIVLAVPSSLCFCLSQELDIRATANTFYASRARGDGRLRRGPIVPDDPRRYTAELVLQCLYYGLTPKEMVQFRRLRRR